MISLIIFICGIFAAEATGVPEKQWDRSCRMEFYNHYFGKNCVPQGNGKCPQYFSCPQFQMDKQRCFYEGRAYELGEPVPVTGPCNVGCFCSEPFSSGDFASIQCPITDCPDVFQSLNASCRLLFSHDKCCSNGEICFHDGRPTRPAQVTCRVNNEIFYKGQYVKFKNYPCQSCICQEGFDGAFGPGCTTNNCGFDYNYNNEFAAGCVPLYREGSCCNFGFVCPGDSSNLPSPSAPSADDGPSSQQNQDSVCYLGNRQFKLGERLQRKRCEEVCMCRTPPELTCIEFKTCQDASNNNIFPNDF